jgi:hypothetical protein
MPQLAFINTSLVAKEQRSYNLYFGALETQETEIEYLLPPNLKLKYLPATISEETPWLKFKVDYQKIDNKIVFSQLFQLKCKEIPVAEYPSFKEFFAGLAKKIKQRIVLERSR